jgi:hypothetical protein
MIIRLNSSVNIDLYLFLIISTFLVFKYFGGTGDIALYINAGHSILKGVNPYLNSEYANSPVAAVLILFVSKLFPESIFPLFIQLLNIVGIVFFANLHKSVFKTKKSSHIVLTLLALSVAFRALLSNIQVTGLILGLYAFAIYLTKKTNSSSKMVGFLLIGIAVELKPQVALPFALIFVLRHLSFPRIIFTTFFFALMHVALSVLYGQALEVLWFDKIRSYSSKSFLPGPEISPFKFLALLVNQQTVLKVVGVIVLLALYLAIVFKSVSSHKTALLIASIVPLLSSYSHMYDFVPLMLIVGFGNYLNKGKLVIFMSAMIIPPNLSQNIVLMVVILLFLIFDYKFLLYSRQRKFRSILSLLYSIAMLQSSKFISSGDVELEMSVRLIFLLPILFMILGHDSKIKKIADVGSK